MVAFRNESHTLSPYAVASEYVNVARVWHMRLFLSHSHSPSTYGHNEPSTYARLQLSPMSTIYVNLIRRHVNIQYDALPLLLQW